MNSGRPIDQSTDLPIGAERERVVRSRERRAHRFPQERPRSRRRAAPCPTHTYRRSPSVRAVVSARVADTTSSYLAASVLTGRPEPNVTRRGPHAPMIDGQERGCCRASSRARAGGCRRPPPVGPARSQDIEADPGGHRGQPACEVWMVAVSWRERRSQAPGPRPRRRRAISGHAVGDRSCDWTYTPHMGRTCGVRECLFQAARALCPSAACASAVGPVNAPAVRCRALHGHG